MSPGQALLLQIERLPYRSNRDAKAWIKRRARFLLLRIRLSNAGHLGLQIGPLSDRPIDHLLSRVPKRFRSSYRAERLYAYMRIGGCSQSGSQIALRVLLGSQKCLKIILCSGSRTALLQHVRQCGQSILQPLFSSLLNRLCIV